MYTSHHTDRKTSNSNLMALKAKLESLDQSFKSNLLSISDHEIENLKNNNFNNEITAWNWSKSFTQQ